MRARPIFSRFPVNGHFEEQPVRWPVAVAVSRPLPLRRGVAFGVAAPQWELLVIGALAGAALPLPWYVGTTLWAGAGLLLTLLVTGHLCLVADRYIALPGLIVFSACLQWIAAPWLSELYPPAFAEFRLVVPLDRYLAYAVPATALLWLGLHWPLRHALRNPPTARSTAALAPSRRLALDAVIVLGVVAASLWDSLPAGWMFFVHIVASFRFFGALYWMLSGTRGWRIRTAAVFAHALLQAVATGLFYYLIHWAGYFLLAYGFRWRWRWQFVPVLIVSLLMTFALQEAKVDYRRFLQLEDAENPVERLTTLGTLVWRRIVEHDERSAGQRLGDVLVRFNQGWIISRVMRRVPDAEPYARGRTLVDAAIFSLVPRALYPEKRQGAARSLLSRYAGVQLGPSTTMGLSIIGESYANFGHWGGLIATGLYGWLIGLLFARLTARAHRQPLWWAVIPVLLLPTVDPGFNIEDVSNHIVKAGLVIAVLAWSLRALQPRTAARRW